MAGQLPPEEKNPSVKAMTCFGCGAPYTLKAPGETVTFACPSCGALQHLTKTKTQQLVEAGQKALKKPLLPLGQRGAIRGETYEVIGFMIRSDKTGDYVWSEYLLYNPYKGFRWLMEYYGHWTFLQMTKKRPDKTLWSNSLSHEGIVYQLFLTGKARVLYVLGEFYWQVSVGDTTDVRDYINPPFILCREKDESEEIWSAGEYLEPSEIKKGFSLPLLTGMPWRSGIGANQPNRYKKMMGSLLGMTVIFFVLLTAIQVKTSASSLQETAYSGDFHYETTGQNQEQIMVTPPFTLHGEKSNVKIYTTSSELQNNWLYLTMSLVPELGGEPFSVGRELSFYEGYDSDGHWSEGSKRDSFYFSKIPGGDYRLTMNVEGSTTAPFSIVVYRDMPPVENYLASLALIAIIPALMIFLSWRFENKRWQESDPTGTGE